MIVQISYLDTDECRSSFNADAHDILPMKMYIGVQAKNGVRNKEQLFKECCQYINAYGVYRQEKWIPSHRIFEVKVIQDGA
jgi:uncharacterized protein (UPF0248 family)